MLSDEEITQLFDKHRITASERRIALAREVERAVLVKVAHPLPEKAAAIPDCDCEKLQSRILHLERLLMGL